MFGVMSFVIAIWGTTSLAAATDSMDQTRWKEPGQAVLWLFEMKLHQNSRQPLVQPFTLSREELLRIVLPPGGCVVCLVGYHGNELHAGSHSEVLIGLHHLWSP